MELLIGLLAGLDPITALFVFISAAQSIYIVKELRKEAQTISDLRDKIEEMNKTHHEICIACQDERIGDLKDLIEKYNTSSRLIASALAKLGRKL